MDNLTALFHRVRRGLLEVFGTEDDDGLEVKRISKEVERVVEGVFANELVKR